MPGKKNCWLTCEELPPSGGVVGEVVSTVACLSSLGVFGAGVFTTARFVQAKAAAIRRRRAEKKRAAVPEAAPGREELAAAVTELEAKLAAMEQAQRVDSDDKVTAVQTLHERVDAALAADHAVTQRLWKALSDVEDLRAEKASLQAKLDAKLAAEAAASAAADSEAAAADTPDESEWEAVDGA